MTHSHRQIEAQRGRYVRHVRRVHNIPRARRDGRERFHTAGIRQSLVAYHAVEEGIPSFGYRVEGVRHVEGIDEVVPRRRECRRRRRRRRRRSASSSSSSSSSLSMIVHPDDDDDMRRQRSASTAECYARAMIEGAAQRCNHRRDWQRLGRGPFWWWGLSRACFELAVGLETYY